MSQTFIVPKISNGPASAATFNTPLEYIQTALNILSGQADAASKSGAILQYQAPVKNDVSVGDLVYYNKNNARFEKALAALSSQTGADGQAIQEDSSRVQGIVLSINGTENSATILRNGYYQSSAVLGAIGTGASAGLYYLSPTTPGKATLTPGWDVRMPCISYYGDGKFSMISNYFAHIGDGDSVVRSVLSSTLNVQNTSGNVTVNVKDKTVNTPSANAYAISGLSNTTIALTPIVSMLLDGPGIKTKYKGDGVWSIAQDSLVNKPLTASQFTLNGAQRAGDTLLTYTVFPSSGSSMTMCMPVDFTATAAFSGSLKVWLTARGPGRGSFNATIYWIPYSSTPITIANCQIGTTVIGTENTSTTQLKYSQSTEVPNITLNSAGVLVAKLEATNIANDVYVHQAGFKLNITEESDSTEESAASSEAIRQQILSILGEYLTWNPNYSEADSSNSGS